MASVTQKINNYVLGMSTQPDEMKRPGQVVDLVNGIPDVVSALQKRPGSSLITTLSPSTAANSKWFHIYTSDTEQYIGQAAPTGTVKIWRCSDGVEIPVDYNPLGSNTVASYLDNTALSDETSSDIQVMTINETTFFVNRRKTTAMKSDPNSKSPARLHEAYIELDTISYGKQYALDIYDPNDNTTYSYTRATTLVVDEDGTFGGTSLLSEPGDGSCAGMGRETVLADNNGTDPFSTSPPNMSAGGKYRMRYELDTRCTPQPMDQGGDIAGDTYYDAYSPYCKLQFGGEGWTTNDTHQYTSKKGVVTTVQVKNHVTLTSRGNVALVRPAPTSSNNEEHVSAAGILGDIKATLDAISGTGITTTIVGNGLHLYRNTPFGVTSPERNLMNVVTSEANNIADLPRTGRHGYTVRIVNSGEDMDDYYLKFQVEGISADIDQTGTYARSGTTVTITATAHGLENGDQIIADFTSGAATDGFYTIANVTTNTFTTTDPSSGSDSLQAYKSKSPSRSTSKRNNPKVKVIRLGLPTFETPDMSSKKFPLECRKTLIISLEKFPTNIVSFSVLSITPTSMPIPALALPFSSYAIPLRAPISSNVPFPLFRYNKSLCVSLAMAKSGHPSLLKSNSAAPNIFPGDGRKPAASVLSLNVPLPLF